MSTQHREAAKREHYRVIRLGDGSDRSTSTGSAMPPRGAVIRVRMHDDASAHGGSSPGRGE